MHCLPAVLWEPSEPVEGKGCSAWTATPHNCPLQCLVRTQALAFRRAEIDSNNKRPGKAVKRKKDKLWATAATLIHSHFICDCGCTVLCVFILRNSLTTPTYSTCLLKIWFVFNVASLFPCLKAQALCHSLHDQFQTQTFAA